MAHIDEPEFDDPALKRAIQRSLGREAVPGRLRLRVQQIVASAEAGAVVTRKISRRPLISIQNIAASLFLLAGLGLMTYQFWTNFHTPSYQSASVPATQIPESVQAAMIQTHDRCTAMKDHHLVGGDDWEAIRKELLKEEGINVLAVDLRKDGWQFKGAGRCNVGDMQAAHLLYTRSNQVISVFSLPATSGCHSGDGSCIVKEIQKHPTASFVRGGGIYSVVGSSTDGKLTLADVDGIAKLMRASLPTEVARHSHDAVALASH